MLFRSIALILAGGFGIAVSQLGDKSKFTLKEIVKYLNNIPAASLGEDRWYSHPYKKKKLCDYFGFGSFGEECIKNAHNMWNGGNQWSGWVCYLSFFRHVAKLDIDYSHWDAYEKLAELSGPRVLHKDFCIISDRPEILTVDPQNRPHNDDGPFCQWRDGAQLFSVHNVRVPKYVITNPSKITVEDIEKEENAEVRRVKITKYGQEKFIIDSKASVVHVDDFGTLYRKEIPNDEALMMVKVVNSTVEPDGTFKDYFIRVDPNAYGGIKTAKAAVASTWRNPDGSMLFKSPDEYNPMVET